MKKVFLLLCIMHCAFCVNTNAQRKLSYVANSTINKEDVDLRVYNNTSGEGFVILGDETVLGDNNILGYSDTGSFDYESLPENAKWWLSQYQLQISELRTETKSTTQQVKRQTMPKLLGSVTADTIVVKPLVTAKWSQTTPYNDQCPKVSGTATLVGCGATAMSQIMYFWKWPAKGHGQHSYQWNNTTLSCNFSESVYDWSDMINTYTTTTASYKKKAVAKLCSDVGISINMNYGISSSGTYSDLVPDALTSYFGYDKSAEYVERNAANTTIWDDMLKTELDAGRPIFYSGSDPSMGGHAFICDGYSVNDYFHFNFGWGGNGNAYFKTSILGPAGNKYYFKNNQAAVIGIKPRTVEKVDNLFYILDRSNKTAEVTYPSEGDEYAGDIVLPSKITVNDTTYNVTTIGNGAFADCTELTALTVPWTTCPVITSETFSETCFNQSTLIVPANCLNKYMNAENWFKFCHLSDKNGNTITWDAWTTILDGVGTYTYTEVNPLVKAGYVNKTVKNMPIKTRVSVDVADTRQFWIEGWNYNTDLLVVCDTKTQNCTVPKQNIGWNMPIYASDVPTFNANTKYENYPCTYDSIGGVFSLYLVYFYDDGTTKEEYGRGTESFQVKGIADNSMSVIINEDKTYNKKFGLTLNWGESITQATYKRFEGKLTKEEVATNARKIADGDLTSTKASKGTSQYATPDPSKDYTFIFVGYSEKDSLLYYENHCYITVNFNNYTTDINDLYDEQQTHICGVYNLSGIKVKDDTNEVDELPKGIYIVNGKKILIR